MVVAKKRRKNATTSTVSLSLFLSRVSGSIKYNVPELKFLLLCSSSSFLARNVFFFINPKIEKSQTKDIKIIFLVKSERRRKKESVKERALETTGRASTLFSRLSFCLSLSLSLCERPRKIGAMMMQNATT